MKEVFKLGYCERELERAEGKREREEYVYSEIWQHSLWGESRSCVSVSSFLVLTENGRVVLALPELAIFCL